MNIPKNCSSCEIRQQDRSAVLMGVCPVTNESVNNNLEGTSLPDWCYYVKRLKKKQEINALSEIK